MIKLKDILNEGLLAPYAKDPEQKALANELESELKRRKVKIKRATPIGKRPQTIIVDTDKTRDAFYIYAADENSGKEARVSVGDDDSKYFYGGNMESAVDSYLGKSDGAFGDFEADVYGLGEGPAKVQPTASPEAVTDFILKDTTISGKPTTTLRLGPGAWEKVKTFFDNEGRPKSPYTKGIAAAGFKWNLHAGTIGGTYRIYGVSGDYTFGNAPAFYPQRFSGNKKAAKIVLNSFVDKFLKHK